MNIDQVVRVAAVQAAPVWLDKAKSTDKAITLIEEAAAGGAQLVAFGESWLPGFPFWVWLGTPAWGSDYFVELHQNSVEIDGPELAAIRQTARQCGVEVVLGATERDSGSLYCTLFFIGADGSLRGRHRKLKPTHVERSVWGEGDGSDLFVLDTPIGRVGGLNCWEHLQPLSKYSMYAGGEQIHVAAWPALSIYNDTAYALGVEANLAASRVYALEGQVYVLAVTSLVDESVYSRLCDTEERQRLLEMGGGTTTVFAPSGSTLAGPLGYTQEDLLMADLDLAEIRRAKQAADPAGHNARADATRLVVSRTPRRPIEVDDLPDPPGSNPADALFNDNRSELTE